MDFSKYFDDEVVERYKFAPFVRAATVRMGHIERTIEAKSPSITITEHRIAELERCCDWGDTFTDAPRIILHHAQNANDLIANIVRGWSIPCYTYGLRSLHKVGINSIKKVRERIDPVLYGIERELDPRKAARAAYDALEDKAFHALNDLFDPTKTAHVPKSKLRSHQISGVCKILIEYQRDLQIWGDELKERLDSH